MLTSLRTPSKQWNLGLAILVSRPRAGHARRLVPSLACERWFSLFLFEIGDDCRQPRRLALSEPLGTGRTAASALNSHPDSHTEQLVSIFEEQLRCGKLGVRCLFMSYLRYAISNESYCVRILL